MNISKLSPFGYDAKSKNGNSYKATNANTSTLLAYTLATTSAPYIVPKLTKNTKAIGLANAFSSVQMFTKTAEKFAKIELPPKAKSILVGLGIANAVVIDLLIGRTLDHCANKKRAAKADSIAEIDNQNLE